MLDDRSWQSVEGAWLAQKAAERKPTQGAPDDLMVVWNEALRKSEERSLRAKDRASRGKHR